MGGNFVFPGGGAYHASKYAVEAISDALRFEVKGFGVGVTVIQPGTIRTEFASTANERLPEGEGPYAAFNAEVGRATRDAYEKGPLTRLGGEPDAVAEAVEEAIAARRAPIRTRVTASAHVLVTLRRLLPDRGWDALVATQFKRPGS
jgi:NAD(P)-dependent dehydrogenase (short-subunit alcohol dehydrogenase family)